MRPRFLNILIPLMSLVLQFKLHEKPCAIKITVDVSGNLTGREPWWFGTWENKAVPQVDTSLVFPAHCSCSQLVYLGRTAFEKRKLRFPSGSNFPA